MYIQPGERAAIALPERSQIRRNNRTSNNNNNSSSSVKKLGYTQDLTWERPAIDANLKCPAQLSELRCCRIIPALVFFALVFAIGHLGGGENQDIVAQVLSFVGKLVSAVEKAIYGAFLILPTLCYLKTEVVTYKCFLTFLTKIPCVYYLYIYLCISSNIFCAKRLSLFGIHSSSLEYLTALNHVLYVKIVS